MTDLDLTGRTALVTGGAQGLGEGIAQALAANGARVVIADLQDGVGEKVADSLKGDGHGFVHLDVTDEAGWRAAVAAAQAAFGSVDVLVNNAGIVRYGSVEDQTPEDFRLLLEINLVGTFLGMRAVLPTMRRQRRGSVVKSPQRLAWSGTQA